MDDNKILSKYKSTYVVFSNLVCTGTSEVDDYFTCDDKATQTEYFLNK